MNLAASTDLALYIHIPFCVRRCEYCDFFSVTGATSSLIEQVLNKILADCQHYLAKINPSQISTIFMGGGTPSLIPRPNLLSFLNDLNSITGPVKEFSIEANPESLDKEFLSIIASAGVNRLSLGVQTYNDAILTWLGRPAQSDIIMCADACIQKHWQGRVSRDLMAALPGDSSRLLSDIARAIQNDCHHISIYELTVEEGTALANNSQKLQELPNTHQKWEEWNTCVNLLQKKGFVRYEVSNFARNQQFCAHNMAYWQMHPYLGIGPGAASTLWTERGALRRTEAPHIGKWLASNAESSLNEYLGTQEFALEHYMMGLRTQAGLNCAHFEKIFGMAPQDLTPHCIAKWQKNGHLCLSSEALYVPKLDIVDAILVDAALEIYSQKFKSPYSWPAA